MAVASRSPVDEGGAARGILGALELQDMFCCLEIHRGSKAVHFQVDTALFSVPKLEFARAILPPFAM